ncbi:MAG: hypothetical protein IJK52_00455 [Oscillospiraceae bacterium]|nr:hypothetical protein [Oscillospiraceae bacterium]
MRLFKGVMKLFKGKKPRQDINKSQDVMDTILGQLENGENPALSMSEQMRKGKEEYGNLDDYGTISEFDI